MDKENQNEPRTVNDILRKIEEKADTGEYLYRGEPEHYQEHPYYGKVSSNLYRVFLEDDEFDVEAEHFDIKDIQKVNQRNQLEVYKSIHKGLNRERQGDSDSG